MSTYLKMWEGIKELEEAEADIWIKRLTPARGVEVTFWNHVKVIDIDLLEALKHWRNDISPKTREVMRKLLRESSELRYRNQRSY